ncbi:MAG TPA: carboxypeptidase regulatory-like domain-containing protein [Myxococcaceae bacterium]|nr:carboxypeptidase regulatory-like domain-containing protein [Myxococcaceae bacterium]
MKKLVMAAVIPVLAMGCGDEMVDANGDGIADGVQTPDNVSVVVPAKPRGTVSGQVLTTEQQPLVGATVTLTIGSTIASNTATTDQSGNFSFKDIPGGAQVLLTFSSPGYASLRAVSTVPNEAGNIPINDGNASFGPVVLSRTNGTVRFSATAPTGRPAEGVKASLEVLNAGTILFGPTTQVTSTVVAEATADAQGVFTFNNVPPPAELDRLRGTYRLIIHAHDANGDGVLESNGETQDYSGEDILTGANAKPLALSYTYAPTNLRVNFTNLTAIRGGSRAPQFNMIRPGDSIFIGFDQPVQPNSVVVGLTDEYGNSNLSISKAFSTGNTVLTLTPQGIQPGKEYNLYYRAVTTTGSSSNGNTVAFFGGDPASPPAISIDNVRFQESGTNNGLIENGESVYVTFNQVLFPRLNPFSPQLAYVYVHADLNNSGRLGDATGERDPLTGRTAGPNSGFPLVSDEPTAPIATKSPAERPVFPIGTSGYTTRFRFVYSPPQLPTGLYTPLNPTSNFPVFIHFSNLSPTTDAYESGWGVPQMADITINGSSITPIPIPVAVP